MAAIPINSLPEKTTAATDDLIVVQAGPDTKKMKVSTLNTLTDSGVNAHMADPTAAHAASAVSAAPSGSILTATDVQAQLVQADAKLVTINNSTLPPVGTVGQVLGVTTGPLVAWVTPIFSDGDKGDIIVS